MRLRELLEGTKHKNDEPKPIIDLGINRADFLKILFAGGTGLFLDAHLPNPEDSYSLEGGLPAVEQATSTETLLNMVNTLIANLTYLKDKWTENFYLTDVKYSHWNEPSELTSIVNRDEINGWLEYFTSIKQKLELLTLQSSQSQDPKDLTVTHQDPGLSMNDVTRYGLIFGSTSLALLNRVRNDSDHNAKLLSRRTVLGLGGIMGSAYVASLMGRTNYDADLAKEMQLLKEQQDAASEFAFIRYFNTLPEVFFQKMTEMETASHEVLIKANLMNYTFWPEMVSIFSSLERSSQKLGTEFATFFGDADHFTVSEPLAAAMNRAWLIQEDQKAVESINAEKWNNYDMSLVMYILMLMISGLSEELVNRL